MHVIKETSKSITINLKKEELEELEELYYELTIVINNSLNTEKQLETLKELLDIYTN